MNVYLGKWLKKLGIRDITEATDEEKQSFERWKSILSAEEELTTDNIFDFCSQQRSLIESKWSDTDRNREHDAYLADIYNLYGQIQKAIKAPQEKRKMIEREIQQLLDIPEQDIIK